MPVIKELSSEDRKVRKMLLRISREALEAEQSLPWRKPGMTVWKYIWENTPPVEKEDQCQNP